jgi:hypothetical protein
MISKIIDLIASSILLVAMALCVFLPIWFVLHNSFLLGFIIIIAVVIWAINRTFNVSQ